MTLPRRAFLRLATAALLPVLPRIASAESYPSRPVRLIVPFPAGNASDVVARLVAQALSERLGQSVIVENRPGAGGTIGTEAVVRAAPDGYTLAMEVVTSNAINAAVYTNLTFDFVRDIAPVASIGSAPYIVVVNPSVPAKTIPEFIAYAKANPGKINMASTGSGTPTHVFGELFKTMTGIDMVHVPYRGSFMTDLLSGQVQVVFGPMSQSIEYIRAGKLHGLAVTTAARQAALPDVPAVSEFVPGYEARAWYGIGAPRNTPAEIVERLNKEINAGLADPKIQARLADLAAAMPMTTADFAAFTAAESQKWAAVVRAANIKAN